MSVMVIGNSYAQHIGENLRIYFKSNYSDFKSIAIVGNSVIYGGENEYSRNALEVSMKLVESYKPDVLIVINRFLGEMKTSIKEKDELIMEMNRNIAYYEK
uniref:SGNH domain-containing protein n=1 Tax=Caenorhabditis tropicalis TaxID=1561998 RepID=A0A1I7UKA7_9PELO